MRIYVAAPWKRKEEARDACRRLQAAGHLITARWVEFHGDTTDPDELAIEAIHDLEDIDEAEVLILLNLEQSEGKAVETGVALIEGLQIIGVGKPTNVFHYLPEIVWVDSLDEAIDVLARADDSATTHA